MSSVFEGYERQYCELSANLSRILADLAGLNPEEYKAKLKEVDAGITEAEGLVKRMDLEARSLPPAQKASLLAKIRELKSDLALLKKDYKACPPTPPSAGASNGEVSVRVPADRSELLHESDMSRRPGGSLEHSGRMDGGGAKMMSTSQRLEQSSERLEQSRRMLVETEDLGVSILEDLHQQRQTLLHARDSLYGVDDSVARARQVLNSMARNINRNRWVAGAAAFILLAAIILVVVIKLRSHS